MDRGWNRIGRGDVQSPGLATRGGGGGVAPGWRGSRDRDGGSAGVAFFGQDEGPGGCRVDLEALLRERGEPEKRENRCKVPHKFMIVAQNRTFFVVRKRIRGAYNQKAEERNP